MNTVAFRRPITDAQQRFQDASLGRDQSIYQGGLNAADQAKARIVIQNLMVPEGGSVLSIGSGTGNVEEILAQHYSRCTIFGLDLSHELLEVSDRNRKLMVPVFGDAREAHFPPGSVDAVISLTCFHEIRSFGGEEALRETLREAYRVLKPGGMLLIRDMVIPEETEPLLLWLPQDDSDPKGGPQTSSLFVDYERLSSYDFFFHFQRDFAHGKQFPYTLVDLEGKHLIRLAPEWAYEFFMRKDYRRNYRNEILERYGVWTPTDAVRCLDESGFSDVRCTLERNDWIISQRLRNKVGLFRQDEAGKLKEVDFYPTHAMVLARKPLDDSKQTDSFNLPEAPDYASMLESMLLDRQAQTIHIGATEFPIDVSSEISGTKRSVFSLRDDASKVLKIPRRDGINAHNCFKAMYQTISRQYVLDEYQVPHLKILNFDHSGPPYRFLVQERLPHGARCAADLILEGALEEEDVRQMADIINRFEMQRRFQLDTNPYNWYRVQKPDGHSEMVYADGKVYLYDERWTFKNIGLLQWVSPELLPGLSDQVTTRCAEIPRVELAENSAVWWTDERPIVHWWKKYLHSTLQPS